MKRFYRAVFLVVAFCISDCSFLSAFETKTHQIINEFIAKNELNGFSLGFYLKDHLGIREGSDKIFDSEKVFEWLRIGGEKEDLPGHWYEMYRRSMNHYHDPLTKKGFNVRGRELGESTLQWAQKPSETQDMGHYSWHDVREYFYDALTSKLGNDRDKAFAETFRGLGQVMHLVEDMSVPDHVRNSAHFRGYEDWVKEEVKGSYELSKNAPIFLEKSLLMGESPFTCERAACVPLANLFDTDQYDGGNPKDTLDKIVRDGVIFSTIGLAEYTNANFFSDRTIRSKDYPFPDVKDAPIEDTIHIDENDPNHEISRKYYLWNLTDEDSYRLATVPFMTSYYDTHGSRAKHVKSLLDEKVYRDYADRLIPRAIGYGSQAMWYFFRGHINMSPAEIGSGYVIENNSEEDMYGDFEIYYDDTDGERWPVKDLSKRPVRWTNLSIPAGGRAHVEANFNTPDDMGFAEEYVLVFRGRLGDEEDAVAGRIPVSHLKDYLRIRVGGGGLTSYVVVWDLAAERPATHIRDKEGNLVTLPCEEERISGWYDEREKHKDTMEIWRKGKSVDHLTTEIGGFPAKPENWDDINHGYEIIRCELFDNLAWCIEKPCVHIFYRGSGECCKKEEECACNSCGDSDDYDLVIEREHAEWKTYHEDKDSHLSLWRTHGAS